MAAVADFLDKRAEHIESWKDLVRTDPRRGSIKGDTALDGPYVIAQLRLVIQDPGACNVWSALVDAGLITALCKCAFDFRAMLMHHADGPKLSKAVIEKTSTQLHSPYQPPLEIICNGTISAPKPPTVTEHKIVQDMRTRWDAILQRIWSEPARTLDSEPKMVVERLMIVQLVLQLSLFDASFLDVILKPSDMTIAVIFRNLLYSTGSHDSLLLPRMLLGASRAAGSKTKRTPAQASYAIVPAFVAHLNQVDISQVKFELKFFEVLLTASSKEYRKLVRAICKSYQFWSALANVLRRAENAPTDRQYITVKVLAVYLATTPPALEGREHVDELIHNWVAGGLLDVLEISMGAGVFDTAPGSKLLSNLAVFILNQVPTLTDRTCAALLNGASEQKMLRDALMLHLGRIPDPGSPMWPQAAWQALASLTAAVEDPGACAGRAWRPTRSATCAR
ncbi:hypothetical protein BD413DRAFT_604077 [Trametes elegans]|nr:hypothetical protein BD413DRAFT_604077 [Trametes elegans]